MCLYKNYHCYISKFDREIVKYLDNIISRSCTINVQDTDKLKKYISRG